MKKYIVKYEIYGKIYYGLFKANSEEELIKNWSMFNNSKIFKIWEVQ